VAIPQFNLETIVKSVHACLCVSVCVCASTCITALVHVHDVYIHGQVYVNNASFTLIIRRERHLLAVIIKCSWVKLFT